MHTRFQKILLLSVMALMVFGVAAMAFSSVQAAGPSGIALQTTPMPGDNLSPTGIPNTGTVAATPGGLGWVIWAILGISVLALIVALATRSYRNDF